MATRRRKVSTRRSRSNRGGYRSGRSSAKRTVRKSRSYARTGRRTTAKRRTSRRSVAAGNQRNIVIRLETAGSEPIRTGDAVGVGKKVAKAPRLKPKF